MINLARMKNLVRISHKGRSEMPESVVDTRRGKENTRRRTFSTLRMFFERNAVDAILSGIAVDRL